MNNVLQYFRESKGKRKLHSLIGERERERGNQFKKLVPQVETMF